MKIEWNLPNKLTIFRIILVPVYVAAALYCANPVYSFAVFAIASLTDMVDGKIARKYNLITDFGKFFDPLADKILVLAAFAVFNELGWASCWYTVVIFSREFFVSGIRLVAASSGEHKVIPAGLLGKLKTASTMVALCAIMIAHSLVAFGAVSDGGWVFVMTNALMSLCAALTVASAVPYVIQK